MTTASAWAAWAALAVTVLHQAIPPAASAMVGHAGAIRAWGPLAALCGASLLALQYLGSPALPELGDGLMLLGCVTACAACSVAIAHAHHQKHLGRLPLLVVLVVLFACVPRWVLPRDIRAVGVVLGFDAALSAYSYAVHGKAERRAGRWREMLFFVVVNPVLVFHDRGRRVAGAGCLQRGLLRLGGGILTIAAYEVIDRLALAPEAQDWLGIVPRQLRSLAFLVVWMVAIYLLHSGLASVRLACMRLLGWEVPERYRMPLASRSPADFWRRWNTYLGSWVRVYVFLPLSLKLRRSYPRCPKAAASAAAVVSSFAFVGVLHDLCLLLQGKMLTGPVLTLAFIAQALVLVLWERAAEPGGDRAARSPFAFLLARPVLFVLLTVMASVVLPALGT